MSKIYLFFGFLLLFVFFVLLLVFGGLVCILFRCFLCGLLLVV